MGGQGPHCECEVAGAGVDSQDLGHLTVRGDPDLRPGKVMLVRGERDGRRRSWMTEGWTQEQGFDRERQEGEGRNGEVGGGAGPGPRWRKGAVVRASCCGHPQACSEGSSKGRACLGMLFLQTFGVFEHVDGYERPNPTYHLKVLRRPTRGDLDHKTALPAFLHSLLPWR